MSEKFFRYHTAQRWLAKNSELYKKSRSHAFQIICEHLSHVMEVERVGIWFFINDLTAIKEELTYLGNSNHSSGEILTEEKFENYFKILKSNHILISHDSQKDPVMAEFRSDYLSRLNIRSILDAPIFSDGELIGILCLESLRLRTWDNEDIGLSSYCADLVARVIETEKRKDYERELHFKINYLETDLKKKLDDLNEAKMNLDFALEGAQVGKWSWDILTGALSLNKTWYTKLGYEDKELPEDLETFRHSLHPDDEERVFEQLQNHLMGKSLFYECRYRMVTKNGEIQWVLDRGRVVKKDESGAPLRVTGVNINVTPIVQLEESLMASERQLKSMIESLPLPVAMLDRELKYIAFSSRWVQEWKKFGDPKNGALVGSSMRSFKPEWVNALKEGMTGSILGSEGDLVEIAPGVEMWLRWTIQPWKSLSGEINGVIVMAENITQKKEADMKLSQASKLTALGEMAAGIAHEINNPLSIIKGYIDLLRRHSSRHSLNEELLLQYILKMDQTVGRISRIVSGMRRFSRESSMDEKVNYSINKIIAETLDICQERINNNGIAIEIEYLKKEALVYCRPVEISQVILNLINNSFQALMDQPRSWIKISCEELEDFYRVSISDSGKGIPAEIRSKLFQPFFTTKDVGVGTGLGLSISRGIIEEHLGHLYYNDENPNTTFVIEIPKALDTADTKTLL